jgi:uncharacterized cupredoxin-like copper-binding protein
MTYRGRCSSLFSVPYIYHDPRDDAVIYRTSLINEQLQSVDVDRFKSTINLLLTMVRMVGNDSMGKETEAEVEVKPGQSVEATVDADQQGNHS